MHQTFSLARLGRMLTLSSVLAVFPAFASPASGDQVAIHVEIPQINVAEYHRPYVAIWIEGSDRKVAANLAVWYQQTAGAEGEGTKWLPDLRQWWRRSGRALTLPVDGVTGATQPVGKHQLSFTDKQPPLADLPPGDYTLVVEAVREVGGRELLKIPFTWPLSESQVARVEGKRELGTVTLSITP